MGLEQQTIEQGFNIKAWIPVIVAIITGLFGLIVACFKAAKKAQKMEE